MGSACRSSGWQACHRSVILPISYVVGGDGRAVWAQQVADDVIDREPDEIHLVVFPLVGYAAGTPVEHLRTGDVVQEGGENAAPLVGRAVQVDREHLEPIFLRAEGQLF